jgi:hypothetical protein
MMSMRCPSTHSEVCDFARLHADLVLRRLADRFLLVQLREGLFECSLELVGAGLFFAELFVQIASLVLQEALAHSQLPDFLVFDHDLNRVLAPLEAEFQVCTAQRMLELGAGRQYWPGLQQRQKQDGTGSYSHLAPHSCYLYLNPCRQTWWNEC